MCMIHEKHSFVISVCIFYIPIVHIFTCALVLVHFIILSTLDSSPLQKCWIDLLYALANKPKGVVHVVIFRAGLSQVPLEVTNFIQI